jgi:hypothetical protein
VPASPWPSGLCIFRDHSTRHLRGLKRHGLLLCGGPVVGLHRAPFSRPPSARAIHLLPIVQDLRHKTSHNTVDKLKHIITGLNDECNANLPKTGKKQELIERINSLLDGWKSAGNLAQWTRAKAVLYAIRNSGSYVLKICAHRCGVCLHHAGTHPTVRPRTIRPPTRMHLLAKSTAMAPTISPPPLA